MRAERAVAFADLREFIAHLDKHGQIMRVAAPVSRDLEIAEITDRVSKGPADRNVALLFESVRGFGTFLVTRRAERNGRNPRTGKAIMIPACRVPRFKPSRSLKGAVL